MDKIWYLQGGDIFYGLACEKEIFMRKAVKFYFCKNEIIFNEGDPGNCCYYLESGLVRIYGVHDSGKEPVYFLRNEGELFGVSEIIDEYPRIANAQAVSDVVVYKIGRNDFDEILRNSYPLARRVISMLGRRVRHLGDTVNNLVGGNVADRIGRLLLALAYDEISKNESMDRPIRLPHRISQEQLARLGGTTQPTVSEILGNFQKIGLIKIEKRIITIISPVRLLNADWKRDRF